MLFDEYFKCPDKGATKSICDEGGIDEIGNQDNKFLRILLSKSVK